MIKLDNFFSRRLHSLLGVIPVGFFLIEHLFTNYHATGGARSFVEQVEWLWGIPFLLVLETFFIFLPLLYHAIFGLYIALQANNNLESFGTFRNYMFTIQRVTGVVTLIFVVWHVWQTRVQVALYHYSAEDLAVLTSHLLQNKAIFVLYLIGILAAVFHFSNGMWSFLVRWGITIGPRAQWISTWVWMAVFVGISYMGIRALIAFANPDFIDQLAQ
jgi:succinate dehydrogenase / fumarate reductase, cytochrome b subunit